MSTSTNDRSPHPGVNKTSETGGTSEETHLTVKLLGDDWIVENAVGKSIGTAGSREEAVTLARQSAASEKASGITILEADGTVAETVKV